MKNPTERDLVWACEELTHTNDLVAVTERLLNALEQHLYEQKEDQAALSLQYTKSRILGLLRRGTLNEGN